MKTTAPTPDDRTRRAAVARRDAARELADDLEARLADAAANGSECRGCHAGETRAVLARLRKIAAE